jgi:hypothetical protein
VGNDPKPRPPLSLLALLGLLGGVALVAVACAAAVHTACFHPPPPVSRPEGGTPRGDYCAAIDPWRPWISLTVGPCLLVAALWLGFSRHRLMVVGFAVALCVALCINAGIANQLVFSYTI